MSVYDLYKFWRARWVCRFSDRVRLGVQGDAPRRASGHLVSSEDSALQSEASSQTTSHVGSILPTPLVEGRGLWGEVVGGRFTPPTSLSQGLFFRRLIMNDMWFGIVVALLLVGIGILDFKFGPRNKS